LPPVAATHDQNLLQNDTVAKPVNLLSKLFSIVDKTFILLGMMLVSFGV